MNATKVETKLPSDAELLAEVVGERRESRRAAAARVAEAEVRAAAVEADIVSRIADLKANLAAIGREGDAFEELIPLAIEAVTNSYRLMKQLEEKSERIGALSVAVMQARGFIPRARHLEFEERQFNRDFTKRISDAACDAIEPDASVHNFYVRQRLLAAFTF